MRRMKTDLALLFLRVSAGLLLCFTHGIQKYGLLITTPEKFPDPLHLGHVPSLLSAMGAECGCAMLVVMGVFTKLACLPIIFTMAMVAIVVHAHDPWNLTEPSVLYFIMFVTTALLGPGLFSFDGLVRRKK